MTLQPVVRGTRTVLSRLVPHRVSRRADARPYRAAIVKLDRLGDLVLAISAIRKLVAYYGPGECLLVISAAAAPLAAVEFPECARLVLPAAVGHKRLVAEAWKARRAFARVACETVVCLRHQRWDWDELVLGWLGARETFVLKDAATEGYFAHRNTLEFSPVRAVRFSPPPPAGSNATVVSSRELQRHEQILAAVLERPIGVAEVLPRFERIRGAGQPGPIVVAPFGSARIRDFPAAGLARVLERIQHHSRSPVQFVGDATQQSALNVIAAEWRARGLESACAPAMDTLGFAHVIASAALVVTVETATAHLAAAFDRRAVIAIGGGHYGEFGPWTRSARQRWLTRPMDCFGCNWACIYPEPYCLTKIPPAEFGTAVDELLTLPEP